MGHRALVIAVWVIVQIGVAKACPDLAQAPRAKWQTVVQDGVHWLVTPCGERFFSVGVNALEGGYPTAPSRQAYCVPLGDFLSRLGSMGAGRAPTAVGLGL